MNTRLLTLSDRPACYQDLRRIHEFLRHDARGGLEGWYRVTRRDVLAIEKRGADIGKTNREKGRKLMVVGDGRGVPLGVRIAPASPAEVALIESTLKGLAVPRPGPRRPRTKPRRPIYDKAADSDASRLRLKNRGIELIYPQLSNRKKPVFQHGRSLRSYRRRWTTERTVAWLGNFRRLAV